MRIHHALIAVLLAFAPKAYGATAYTGQVWGDLQNATGYALVASSSSVDSFNIQNLSFLDVSTLTVTLRGGRALTGIASVLVNNGAGASRTYTVQVEKAGTAISNVYSQIITTGDTAILTVTWYEASSTAGSNSYTIAINTSNTTGTQTVTSRILTTTEL